MNNNMLQQSYAIKGNKSSFWHLTAQNAIVIPIIQRDYAQGRINDNVRQIREPFLKKIFSILSSEKGNLELDFIYGSLEKPKDFSKSNQEFLDFTPLDGQQRLTTLFLLHWFLSIWNEDCYEVFKKHMSGRFTYRTRTSSTNFCENLIEHTRPSEVISLLCDPEHSISISKQIMDEGWFHNQWKNDPTITGMLNMLDNITVIYLSYSNSKSFDTAKHYFEKLTCDNVNDCPITFNLLYLNQGDFHLSDELYIKMNSRGKPLSDFETFKARFETFLKSTNVPEDFSNKIDGEWADAFWGLRNAIKPKSKESNCDYYRDNTDGMMMNLIKFILANEYAILANDKDNGLDELFESQAAKKQNPNIHLTFYRYTELGVINETDEKDSLEEDIEKQLNDNNAIANAIYNNFQLVCDINNSKDFKLDGDVVDLNINEYLQNVLFNDIDGTDSKYINISYATRLILWSFFSYCIKYKDVIKQGNKLGLNRWMRFIRNMVESVEINTANDMQKAIKYLYSTNLPSDIVAYLASLDETQAPDCSPFPKTQIREEIIKAKLIQKRVLWEKAINKADNVKTWPGRSGYLLYFLGIISSDAILSIDNRHYATIGQFMHYKKVIDSLIPFMDKEKNVILERALLAKGLYMRQEQDGSFIYSLMDKNTSGRSYSWRQMIQYNGIDCRHETSIYKEGVDCLKDVLNDPNFIYSNDETIITKSLLDIIEKGKNSISDWRWPLLDMPEIWSESCQRFIWISQDNRHAWIPRQKGGRTNHYETWAYHLYLSLEHRNGGNKFVYSHNSFNKYVTLIFHNADNRYQLKISHDDVHSRWVFEMLAIDEDAAAINMSVKMRAFVFGLMPNNNHVFYKESVEDAIIWAQAMQKCIAYSCEIE